MENGGYMIHGSKMHLATHSESLGRSKHTCKQMFFLGPSVSIKDVSMLHQTCFRLLVYSRSSCCQYLVYLNQPNHHPNAAKELKFQDSFVNLG